MSLQLTKAGDGHNIDKRPLLVSLSACALSSLGFGLSIIAIWMQWLFPPCDERGQDQLIHYVRQPARNGHKQLHRPSSRDPHSPRLAKHVSFADAKKSYHVTRQATDRSPVPDGSAVVVVPIPRCNSPQLIVDDVATSATSTVDVKLVDDRDPSPIPIKSSSLTNVMHKSDGLFAQRNPCKKCRTSPSSEKSSRECCRRATSLKFPLGKLSSRALPRSATFSFGTRHTRPVPRTMPYGPPYFATPPCDPEKYSL